ncbi:nitrile hydratase subunit alpha [Celeribacter sp.]|uniref:nitrile hydratase subunit alpha n=1 Tax=Celeribacter sp. TaxID=1890673 RepID=UPI003A8EE1FE
MSDDHTAPPEDLALRVKSLETLLTKRGMIKAEAVDAFIQYYETEVGPRNGAKVVAKAWTDPAFREALIEHPGEALSNLGFAGLQGEDTLVVENTPKVHNVVVCTLCSCYPWPLLGLPPTWYKSFAYRSRVVREPRDVLAEFGLDVPMDKEVRVYDSNAELRYFVLPERPAGTEGWSEEALEAIVTRDSMIGTAIVPDQSVEAGA